MTTGRLPSLHLGLDLGATNLKWVVVERRGPDDWSVVARDQVATRITPDVDDVPASVVSQLGEVGRAADGAAGPVQDALGVPVALINDARAFGVAELRLGAGRGARSMVGFTLGTGVGGVFAIDGRVHQGHDGTGGELGHQTIDPNGPMCNCGNRGCLEAFARADRIAEACGTATAEEAVVMARAGDARAAAGIDRVARYLGIGIANMVTVVTPDRVVIGGGIAAAADLLFDPIRDEIARRVHTTSVDEVSLVAAELGTWAGAIGAAVHGAEMAEAAGPTGEADEPEADVVS